MSERASPVDRPVATVRRAVAVLNVLADSIADLGTNEIARRAGINASSASRLLATLARDELVWRMPSSGRWRLGTGLIKLGNAAIGRVDLREVARPHLVDLTEVTGETATLSLPVGHTMITVDFVQSPWSVRSVAEIGRPSATHATAVGKVYLAHGGTLPEGRLSAHATRTITNRAELTREITAVRDRGWAAAAEEREDDLSAIAAPVVDAQGELVGVLGLQGPSGRFDSAAMQAAAEALTAAADRLRERVAQLSITR